jgi:hypothetical protein
LKLVINPEVDTEEKGILWRISPFMRSIYDALGEAKANYLYREEATKENIFNMLPSADVVIATGHGDYNLYTSYKLEPVFYAGQNIDVDGKKFMFLSCRLGKELIPYMESLGAVGAGWVEDFVLMFDKNLDPSLDEVLKLFIQPFVDGALAVASSGNISDAAIVREELKKNASTVSFIDSEIRDALNYNASKFYISGLGTESTAEGIKIDLGEILQYAVAFAFPLTIMGYGIYKKYFKKQNK